jgi:hemolysin activation/secretion protein
VKKLSLLLFCTGFLFCTKDAFAQIDFPQISPPQTEPLFPPLPSIPLPKIDITPDTIPLPELYGQERVKIRQFQFRGNQILSSRKLAVVLDDLVGQTLSISELLDVRTRLTNYYRSQGYVVAVAFLPIADNQALDPKGAIITFRILEGTIEQLEITGTQRLKPLIQNRLKSAIQPAIHQPRLISALYYLQNNPAIKTIRSTLAPSAETGQYILTVAVEPAIPLQVGYQVVNDRTISTGSLGQTFDGAVYSPLEIGDALNFEYSITEGTHQFDARYLLPINGSGGSLTFRYSQGASRIIESSLEPLDITSRSRLYELSFRQPLLQQADGTRLQELVLGGSLSHINQKGTILGFPFPLIEGADFNGEAQSTTLSLFQEYQYVTVKQAIAVRSQLRLGLPIEATQNSAPPDGEFVSWLGQIAYRRQLAKRLNLSTQLNLQLTDRPVFAYERISFTGVQSVRGYPENAVISNSGLVSRTELASTILDGKYGTVSLSPFFDFGIPFERERQSNDPGGLASVGLGLSYIFKRNLRASLIYGIPLVPLEQTSDNLQGQGLVFSLQLRFP